jgi:hypothetical protein
MSAIAYKSYGELSGSSGKPFLTNMGGDRPVYVG